MQHDNECQFQHGLRPQPIIQTGPIDIYGHLCILWW